MLFFFSRCILYIVPSILKPSPARFEKASQNHFFCSSYLYFCFVFFSSFSPFFPSFSPLFLSFSFFSLLFLFFSSFLSSPFEQLPNLDVNHPGTLYNPFFCKVQNVTYLAYYFFPFSLFSSESTSYIYRFNWYTKIRYWRCLEALAELRHVKWFHSRALSRHSCTVVIRLIWRTFIITYYPSLCIWS